MNCRILIASAMLLIVAIQPATAEDRYDNPFRNLVFLDNSLKQIGFKKSRIVLKSKLANGAVSKQGYTRGLGGNGEVKSNSQQIAGFLILSNLLKIKPIKGDRAPYYSAQLDQEAFAQFADERLVRTGQRPAIVRSSDKTEVEVPAGHREVDLSSIDSWDYRQWREGNVEYAMVVGYYRVFVDVFSTDQLRRFGDPSETRFTFQMIIERNPASPNWRFTTYRGQQSGFQRGSDYAGVVRFLNQALPEFQAIFDETVASARNNTIDYVEASEFSGYTLKGDILQIQIDNGKTVLVDTRPLIQNRPDTSIWEPAFEHCKASSLGGYQHWELPSQRRIAELFTGKTFKDWDEFRFKSAPDTRYWGNFFRRAFAGQRTNVYQKWVYFLSSDFELEPPARYSGSDLPRKVPYVVRYWIDMGRVFEGKLRGELQRDQHFESRNSKAIFAFCVNENPEDNADFLPGSVTQQVLTSYTAENNAKLSILNRETLTLRAESEADSSLKELKPDPEVSNLSSAINECLEFDLNRVGAKRISISLEFDGEGNLKDSPALVSPPSPGIEESAYFISAVGAIEACGPYDFLANKNAEIEFGSSGVANFVFQEQFDTESIARNSELGVSGNSIDQPRPTDATVMETIVKRVWAGPVSQPTSSTNYSLSVHYNGFNLNVDYPELSCGGVWILETESDNNAVLRERISYGKTKCVDNGFVNLSDAGNGGIFFEYRTASSGEVLATSLLEPRSVGSADVHGFKETLRALSFQSTDLGSEQSLGFSRRDVAEIQARLLVLGFDPNGVDGAIGKGTRSAISLWQQGIGAPETGYLDLVQLEALRNGSESAFEKWSADPTNAALLQNAASRKSSNGASNSGGYYRGTDGCLRTKPDNRRGSILFGRSSYCNQRALGLR